MALDRPGDRTSSGTPDRTGKSEVVVTADLEQRPQRLDEAALKWGIEKVVSIETVTIGRASQSFVIEVVTDAARDLWRRLRRPRTWSGTAGPEALSQREIVGIRDMSHCELKAAAAGPPLVARYRLLPIWIEEKRCQSRFASVLALHAHPDDVEFQCAGTLILLREAGCEVTIATMTPGDCGSAEYDAEAIAAIRREEARKSAEVIGAEYVCLEFRDLAIFNDDESRGALPRPCGGSGPRSFSPLRPLIISPITR